MVNKSLNARLDSQFDKVNSGGVVVKAPKVKKEKKSKVKKAPNKFIRSLKMCKGYLFPAIHFESVEISDFGTTIVSSVDKGIKSHVKMFKSWFRSVFFRKTQVETEVEPEDVEMSVVKDIIKKNKIKK